MGPSYTQGGTKTPLLPPAAGACSSKSPSKSSMDRSNAEGTGKPARWTVRVREATRFS